MKTVVKTHTLAVGRSSIKEKNKNNIREERAMIKFEYRLPPGSKGAITQITAVLTKKKRE